MKQDKRPLFRYCIVPMCKNSNRNAPNKTFFMVPKGVDIRKKWCTIMRRDMISPSTSLYCCEDHFDLEEDTDNYIQYKIMNLQEKYKTILRLKKGILPHKFHCQSNCTPQPRKNRKQLKIIEEFGPSACNIPKFEKDMANHTQYETRFSQKKSMAHGSVPTKFDCQQDSTKTMSSKRSLCADVKRESLHHQGPAVKVKKRNVASVSCTSIPDKHHQEEIELILMPETIKEEVDVDVEKFILATGIKKDDNAENLLSEFDIKDEIDIEETELSSPVPTVPGSDVEDSLNSDEGSLNTDSDGSAYDSDCDLGERDPEPARPDLSRVAAQALLEEDTNNDKTLRDISGKTCHFNWSTNETDFQARRETFTGTPGPTFSVTTVLDVFYRMIDNNFVDMLCVETNSYASKHTLWAKGKDGSVPNSQLHWVPTDRNEMITFLAIILLQSLHPLPDDESHFSFNGYGTMSYFSQIMTKERFIMLQKLFCFSDPSTTDYHAPGTKIAPVTKYFNNKFANLYFPSQEVVLDEYHLMSQKRLSFAQKLPSKSTQACVKTYELAESSSGYLWQFFIHTGRENDTVHNHEKRSSRSNIFADHAYSSHSNERKHKKSRRISEKNITNDRLNEKTKQTANKLKYEGRKLTNEQNIIHESTTQESNERERQSTGKAKSRDGDRSKLNSVASLSDATAAIVYRLMAPLMGLGHTLIIDNFYNSPLLARILKKNNTDSFGTLRLSREFVPDSLAKLTKVNLSEDEVVTYYCTDLAVAVWRDGNLYSMMSTYHPLQTIKEYNGRLPQKSDIVQDYIKSMRRVDKKDHMLSTHPMKCRDRLWYMNVFYRLLNSAVFNCYVIYKTGKQKYITHRQFRRELAETLLIAHRKLFFKVYKDASVLTSKPAMVAHFPSKVSDIGASCKMCLQSKGVEVQTFYKCTQCLVPLCNVPCFMEYHKTMVNVQ